MRAAIVVGGLGVLAVVSSIAGARPARACGGGLVASVPGGAGAGAQRIFLSVRGSTTDVISEVGVPTTASDYGVLLPVPAEPTLDAEPVPSAELDKLDQATAPHIFITSGTSATDDGFFGGGCACGAGSTSKGGISGAEQGVDVAQPVAIGPVTAVVLTGATGDAVNGWLADNGFALPADQQALVAAYAGPGRYFIALRRTAGTPTGGATSVGVHFTLPVADRTLPLRFARMGAAPQVAFTVFVAAPDVAAPADPFATLTLKDLDAATLRTSGYSAAVAAAVAARGGRAFVVDGAYSASSLVGRIGTHVETLLAPAAQVTRLTTVVSASALTEDVTLDGTFAGTPASTRYVWRSERPPARAPRGGAGLGAAFAVAALCLRRRRRLAPGRD